MRSVTLAALVVALTLTTGCSSLGLGSGTDAEDVLLDALGPVAVKKIVEMRGKRHDWSADVIAAKQDQVDVLMADPVVTIVLDEPAPVVPE